MITLHHLKYSQSFRIVWLLEELQLDYELKVYERLPNYLAPEEYKAISPLGTAPAITTEDGLHLSESNAIIDYIIDRAEDNAKNLRPAPGDASRTNYLFWFHTSAASLQAILSTDTIFRMLPSKTYWPVSAILRKVATKVDEAYLHPRLTAILQLAENQLSKHYYLAGDSFTAADITAIYSFDTVLTRLPELPYPACKAWFDRMRAREAFQASLHKVGQTTISLVV
jgi:glutathione S-transferase